MLKVLKALAEYFPKISHPINTKPPQRLIAMASPKPNPTSPCGLSLNASMNKASAIPMNTPPIMLG